MAEYTTYLTDYGRYRMADAIDAGNLQIVRVEASDVDYRGQETQLTSLDGVFINKPVTVYQDGDKIAMRADFTSNGLTEPKEFKTIGIYGKGGSLNYEFLLCVATTDYPATLEPAIGVDATLSRCSFNFYLQIAGAENVTITGTVAGVLYDSDTVNNLTSTSTTAPLSANMGRVLGQSSNGNLLLNPFFEVNEKGVTSGTTIEDIANDWRASYGSGGVTWSRTSDTVTVQSTTGNSTAYLSQQLSAALYSALNGKTITVSIMLSDYSVLSATGTLASGTTFVKTLNTDAQGNITNFAVTAAGMAQIQQQNVAITLRAVKLELGERSTLANDLAPNKTIETLKCQGADFKSVSDIFIAGTTNTSGAQIDAGTLFYLNGTLCKALTNIAVNASFTLNTNYTTAALGAELASTNERVNKSGVSTSATYREDLTNHVGAANKYTIPADGYISLNLAAGQTAIAIISDYLAIGGAEGRFSTFVRKGMTVYVNTSSFTAAYYYALN